MKLEQSLGPPPQATETQFSTLDFRLSALDFRLSVLGFRQLQILCAGPLKMFK